MKYLTDENFNQRIIKGLLLKLPNLEIKRVQDVGLLHADDPIILEWASQNEYVLLTHDIETMPDFAYERLKQNLTMRGIVVIRQNLPIGSVIEDLILFAQSSDMSEWENQVVYLPL